MSVTAQDMRIIRTCAASGNTMWKHAIILLATLVALTPVRAANKSDASEPFFNEGRVHTLQIEVPTSSLSAFKPGQRDYVRATVRDGTTTWRDVGVRLKGHSTFQPIDRKPGLSLKFNEFVSGQEFHGLSKVNLNNCLQDPSYMREVLAAQLFHDADLPAARVANVRVQLNGRELGFYNLVEGVNKGFLKRAFGFTGGNLYEGESKDIDEHLDQENGDDVSQKDLQALARAALAPAAERMTKLGSVLDVDQFTRFVAMEMLLGSIDGYTFTKNNYRIYHQPKTGRMLFLPHGLDATFGKAAFTPPQSSLLVKSLWELPGFQKNYRAHLQELEAKVWQVETLTNRLASLTQKLIAAAPDRTVATQIEDEARKLRIQILQQPELIAAEMRRAVEVKP
jgi:spore coat protein H